MNNSKALIDKINGLVKDYDYATNAIGVEFGYSTKVLENFIAALSELSEIDGHAFADLMSTNQIKCLAERAAFLKVI